MVSSWLLDLTAQALAGDEDLHDFSGWVRIPARAAGRSTPPWSMAVPATVLSAALYRRFRSREDSSYADKLLSAMRKGFGGHQEPKSS